MYVYMYSIIWLDIISFQCSDSDSGNNTKEDEEE